MGIISAKSGINQKQEDSQTSPEQSDVSKPGSLKVVRQRPILTFPTKGGVPVDDVLSQLERGCIQNSNFRDFLVELESTPFGRYAVRICDKLFLVVERNLNLVERHADEKVSEERIALGCAIRKLTFNLDDVRLPRLVRLLNETEKYRTEENATPVEKLLYKSLVDRFEFRPMLRSLEMRLIADRCHRTIIQFGQGIATKSKTTKAVILNAILGFACYSPIDQPPRDSCCFDLPKSLRLLLDTAGEDIQKAIICKIPDERLRPNVLLFIKNLLEK